MAEETPQPSLNPPITEQKGSLHRLPLPGEGWVDRSIYIAGGPIAEGFQSSIVVTFEHRPQLKEFDAYVEETLKNTEAQLEGFEMIDRGQKKLGRLIARYAHYKWTTNEDVPVQQLQYLVHHPPNVGVLTATAHEKAFDALRPTFEKAAAGFAPAGPSSSGMIR